jgi:hypothetical protein
MMINPRPNIYNGYRKPAADPPQIQADLRVNTRSGLILATRYLISHADRATCRRKVEMSPRVQSRDDTPWIADTP